MKLTSSLLQSQLMGLYESLVQSVVQTAQVFITAAAFYKRDLISSLNV